MGSFPYKSMLSENGQVRSDPAGDEVYNLFEALHDAIDVSALTGYGSTMFTVGAAAAGIIGMSFIDGGAAGAGSTNLASTKAGLTAGWTDVTPRAPTFSTTLADVDKGDWINTDYDETATPTAATTGYGHHLAGTYGVPGGVT